MSLKTGFSNGVYT